jgi:hypothetical protein
MEKQMETKIDEIASGIYRLSTFVAEIAPPAGFTFNQFLILGDEPLLFHTGPRGMFPLVRSAVARLVAPERLCWITFGHYEADECGAMNEWLAVASQAEVAHGPTGCLVSLNLSQVRQCRSRSVAEDLFNYSRLNPSTGATIRKLAGLSPHTLALMHGPSFSGNAEAALRSLADHYDHRIFGRASAAG